MTISINMKKFENILQKLTEDKQPFAANLFEEMQLMKRPMAEIKATVEEEGNIHTDTHGQKEYPREKLALNAYNTTMGRYNQTYKQLMDILPTEDVEKETDELLEFIAK